MQSRPPPERIFAASIAASGAPVPWPGSARAYGVSKYVVQKIWQREKYAAHTADLTPPKRLNARLDPKTVRAIFLSPFGGRETARMHNTSDPIVHTIWRRTRYAALTADLMRPGPVRRRKRLPQHYSLNPMTAVAVWLASRAPETRDALACRLATTPERIEAVWAGELFREVTARVVPSRVASSRDTADPG